MDMNEFQRKALGSVGLVALKKKDVDALAHRSLGLAGEAGEVASLIKKIIRDKQGSADQADMEKISEKLGDTLYYLAVLAGYYDIDLQEIASNNLEKSEAFRKSRNSD